MNMCVCVCENSLPIRSCAYILLIYIILRIETPSIDAPLLHQQYLSVCTGKCYSTAEQRPQGTLGKKKNKNKWLCTGRYGGNEVFYIGLLNKSGL